MNIDIFSTGGFIFFLLIILIGYIFVEIMFGEKYFFRKTLKEYKDNLFDRLLHYIFWGIVLNLVFIYINSFGKNIENITNIFNSSGKLAEILKFLGNPLSIQLILFSISYFIILVIITTVFFYFIKGICLLIDFTIVSTTKKGIKKLIKEVGKLKKRIIETTILTSKELNKIFRSKN